MINRHRAAFNLLKEDVRRLLTTKENAFDEDSKSETTTDFENGPAAKNFNPNFIQKTQYKAGLAVFKYRLNKRMTKLDHRYISNDLIKLLKLFCEFQQSYRVFFDDAFSKQFDFILGKIRSQLVTIDTLFIPPKFQKNLPPSIMDEMHLINQKRAINDAARDEAKKLISDEMQTMISTQKKYFEERYLTKIQELQTHLMNLACVKDAELKDLENQKSQTTNAWLNLNSQIDILTYPLQSLLEQQSQVTNQLTATKSIITGTREIVIEADYSSCGFNNGYSHCRTCPHNSTTITEDIVEIVPDVEAQANARQSLEALDISIQEAKRIYPSEQIEKLKLEQDTFSQKSLELKKHIDSIKEYKNYFNKVLQKLASLADSKSSIKETLGAADHYLNVSPELYVELAQICNRLQTSDQLNLFKLLETIQCTQPLVDAFIGALKIENADTLAAAKAIKPFVRERKRAPIADRPPAYVPGLEPVDEPMALPEGMVQEPSAPPLENEPAAVRAPQPVEYASAGPGRFDPLSKFSVNRLYPVLSPNMNEAPLEGIPRTLSIEPGAMEVSPSVGMERSPSVCLQPGLEQQTVAQVFSQLAVPPLARFSALAKPAVEVSPEAKHNGAGKKQEKNREKMAVLA